MTDDDFESRVFAFERHWQIHGSGSIDALLDRPPALVGEPRRRLLIELVCIDLEFRWQTRSQERTLLENYAAHYPELGPLDQLPLELIGQEYRVRCQWGDRPSHASYLTRFPARQEQIKAELVAIDRDLHEEREASHGTCVAPARAAPARGVADRALGIELLSHDDVLLRRMIGAGRMGKVYEAWQHSAKRVVAVKFLRKSFVHQPHVVGRFIEEARIISRLRHLSIVAIHGLGRTPGGSCFIVMEHVAGSNLDQRIKAGPISVQDAVGWTLQVCDALGHAHSQGIIHCDLKPANLLLDRDRNLKVTDFGLARYLTEPMPWTAELEGTAAFMAPEQASSYWGPIDVHTDVYGLGAVLYTLLTGQPPWTGRRLPDILASVISAAPVISPTCLRPDLPAAIGALCSRCLSKAPQERYQTIHEVRSALAKIMGDR